MTPQHTFNLSEPVAERIAFTVSWPRLAPIDPCVRIVADTQRHITLATNLPRLDSDALNSDIAAQVGADFMRQFNRWPRPIYVWIGDVEYVAVSAY